MDVSVPVLQIQEQILEVAKVIPQEPISELIMEHAHDVPASNPDSGSREGHSAEAHPEAYRRTHS